MISTQRVSVFIVAIFLCFILLFQILQNDGPSINDIKNISYRPFRPSIHDSILALFDSIRHPITENYTDVSGTRFLLEQPPIWTKPLKKKVLIVDIDTREPSGDNQILNSAKMDWEKLDVSGGELVSNGIMNHYLYAQIHGYDYKFFQAQHIKGHHDTWILPHVLYDLLPDYQFVVTMDADVTITHLEVPLEWLFNRWGLTKHTSISMPWDQEEILGGETVSIDSKGLQVLNTGVVAVQNLEYTFEMLEAWKDCTTEKRYSGCGRWKEEWSHEQRAFSEYIRYDFNPAGDNIVEIPCDDAMGWPGMMHEYEGQIMSDCNGTFFRHHTLRKDKTKESASSAVMQVLSEILQHELLEHKDKVWVKEAERIEVDEAPSHVENVDLSG